MLKIKYLKIFSLILLVFLVFPAPINVKAQQAQTGLSISPPSFELTANPGDIVTNVIKVENLSSTKLTVKAKAESFVAYGQDGQVSLSEEDATYSIKNWITIKQTSFVIEAKKSANIEFTLTVPKDVEPGSHYGAVVFSPTEAVGFNENGAKILQEIGSLMLVKVPGDVYEEAQIQKFSSAQETYKDPNMKLDLLVKNTGTVHFKPFGSIVIRDIFGNKIKTIELTPKNILPGNERIFSNDFQLEEFGPMKAEVTIFYENGAKNQRAETSFFSIQQDKTFKIVGVTFAVLLVYILLRKRINKAVRIIIKGS